MKRTSLSLALACALLPPSPVSAQPADEPEQRPTALDQVTVTARKREETLQDVPVAVTAFTPESIDKLAIEDLSDLDAYVPNLTIYAARATSSTVTAYLRGIGQSDPTWGYDPGVGIYLDDVYIARPQGALLDLFDVERIEVLRGPQGTLYGKNTIGGAIKYISRGLPEETEGFAQLTAGNYGQLDAKAAIGGALGSSALRGRVALASLNRDGFGEIVQSGDPQSDKQINAARLTLGAWFGQNVDLQLAFDWTKDVSGMRGAKMLQANPFAAALGTLDDRYDTRSGMRNISDFEGKGASATLNWRLNDDWNLKYVLARRESDTVGNIDFDTLPLPIADVAGGYDDEQTSHELQAGYDGGGRSRGVLGLYAFDGDAGGVIHSNFFNAQFSDTHGEIRTKSLALYGDWTFDLTERLKLDLGARYTDEDKRGIVANYYTDPTFTTRLLTASDFDRKTSFSNVSPKISLDYALTPDAMVYALATRGFKSGGYNIRANTLYVPRSGEPFDDETVDSLEVGAKLGLLDQRLFLNLAYFHNRYKDIQLSIFTGVDLNGDGVHDQFIGDFTNAGEGTVDGVEVEYQWLPNAHFALTGNLAWLDARYDRYVYEGVDIADTQEFTNAPDFSGAINLEWRTDVGAAGNLSARIGYSYQSEVVATTDIVYNPLTGTGTAPISQDGYGLLNAGVIWKIDAAWTLSLQASNLTDKEYLTTGYNIPAVGVLTGFYGPPRQYSLSLRYDFRGSR